MRHSMSLTKPHEETMNLPERGLIHLVQILHIFFKIRHKNFVGFLRTQSNIFKINKDSRKMTLLFFDQDDSGKNQKYRKHFDPILCNSNQCWEENVDSKHVILTLE